MPGRRVACSGSSAARANELAHILLDEGVEGLLSFGIAGGLAPGLAAGSLVVGVAVETPSGEFPADTGWRRRIEQSLPGALCGSIVGADEIVATPAEKLRLHLRRGALAVDLESAAVAQACRDRDRPFAVLRAIADPMERSIPRLALAGVGSGGQVRPFVVAVGLLRRPQDLPGLIRLAADSRSALGALGVACRALGPSLGFQAD